MYFLVQSNLRSNPDFNRIFDALHELNIAYETIDLTPETKELQLTESRNDVFVYGSVRLAQLAKEKSAWYPGSFYGGNHRVEAYASHLKGCLLNESIQIQCFEEPVNWQLGEELFIKPYREAKLFTGKAFTRNKWTDFVETTLTGIGHPELHKDSLIQVSPVQHLSREARLWIVGGKIVEAAYYRFHGDVSFESAVNPEGLSFAEEMIRRFTVAEAYVMDICQTSEGWKIVEMNCINSAGFYPNVDVLKIVKALVEYFTDRNTRGKLAN